MDICHKENNQDVYRGKDCMKTFCKSLGQGPKKIINFEKKIMIQLTRQKCESYLNQLDDNICKNMFKHKYSTDKNSHKIKNHCHYNSKYASAGDSICSLK